VTYLFYGYPEGVRVSGLADPLVLSILKGIVLDPYAIVATVAREFDEYEQEDERAQVPFQHEWRLLKRKFVPVLT
jgi:hypothetical protein